MPEVKILREGDRAGAANMSRDLEMLASTGEDGVARLRLYGWRRPTLSLGYGQDAAKFDAARLRSLGVDLVRRPTGGRAVLHQHEVTYAFTALQKDLTGDVRSSYLRIAQALIAALLALGVPVDLAGDPGSSQDDANCFAQPSWYEIEAGGRKLLGSAQVRRQGVVLQHGALPLTLDYELWADVFGAKDRAAYALGMRSRAVGLWEAAGREVPKRAVRDALAAAFRDWWTGSEQGV